MIPGSTSKLSEQNVALTTTITQHTDLIRITSTASTTVLANIIPAFSGFSGICFLTNNSGASMTAVTSGNIAGTATHTFLDTRLIVLVYSKVGAKWYVCMNT